MGGGRLFERTLSKTRLFSRGGRLLEGGRLFQNLSPRGGANSKRGAYWKLGAYSSIYGTSISSSRMCVFDSQFAVAKTLKLLR